MTAQVAADLPQLSCPSPVPWVPYAVLTTKVRAIGGAIGDAQRRAIDRIERKLSPPISIGARVDRGCLRTGDCEASSTTMNYY